MALALQLRDASDDRAGEEGGKVLWTIIVILLILWILGLALKIAGGLIYILLVVAIILFIIRLVTGRRV
ncbi:MAG TPA: lmo0937 family membrane protein [Vicinamibacterales bacterium]|nr:lmo0937 family membrane protein [Vicinamibacterales bacterium]